MNLDADSVLLLADEAERYGAHLMHIDPEVAKAFEAIGIAVVDCGNVGRFVRIKAMREWLEKHKKAVESGEAGE